ncbi:response regulator transcription factor [Acetivibrio cellulolyticus]|uniref:response regulator transcription factor n=1 Tax=Acetivibrio cellulolyticus TaxID=35830 RepID=UPI0001E300D7|nr:helix-turn-helix transcriptional regulator [Acetivibrio cellulolyticus]
MTNDIQLYQSLLRSWEVCSEKGISRDLKKPLLKLSADELKTAVKKSDFTNKFNDFMYRYLDTIKNVKGEYCFLLFNSEGYLIAQKKRPGSTLCWSEYNEFLEPGVSFYEESIGTNSVSLAKLLKRPVHIYPAFHYSNKLKNWYEYCIPISHKNKTYCYISVISLCNPIMNALVGLVELLSINIYNESPQINYSGFEDPNLSHKLTEKQNMILGMIAQGFSDEHISQELNLSLATVKYHNQLIFKKLNANSRVDAVVKALMLNELTFYDLYSQHAQ